MPRAGLTTTIVVERAGDVADDVGWDALTLAAVAEPLGVRLPSLYKHVGGLDDLRRRVTVAAVHGLGERLATATDGIQGAAALEALAQAYRRYAREHPGRYAATVRAPAPDDAEHIDAAAGVLTTVLGVIHGFGLEGDTAIDATRAVRSAMHGFVSLETAGGFGIPRGTDTSYDYLVEMLERSLAARS